jgi:Arc/MetJ-type ribon-helix-helix transcriptional regulator
MAKKVTVSIPDFLHEKMEKWRRSFNLSKMLQDAITEAIQRKEDFQKRIQEDLNLTEIIDRLKREKERSEGNFFETGRHDGMAWAKTAHYDDIQYALGWENLENAAKDSVLGSYFAEKIEKIKMKEARLDGVDEYVSVYLAGWKKGLCEFWDEVKQKL